MKVAVILLITALAFVPLAAGKKSTSSSASSYSFEGSTSTVNGVEFSIETASTALMYAYSAYCTETQLTAWSCPYCGANDTDGFVVTNYVIGKVHETFGYVGVNENTELIVVSFRGSVNLPNWLSDFNFPTTIPYPRYPQARVHEGFWHAYDEIANYTISSLDTLIQKYPTYTILITGHSLGAALSVLCAADVFLTLQVPFFLRNFGDPRVGDKGFSDFFHPRIPTANVWRMVNQQDIVPHLPLEAMGFFHITTEVWRQNATTPTGGYKVCSTTDGEDPTCSDSQPTDLSVFDHLHYMDVPCCC